MENGYCSQHVLNYLFLDICCQRTMTNKGAKRNVPQTRINTFYPQAATQNTAAEMFRIVWLSVSGEYAQILIHLSLGQQSYRINFEDEVTTYSQLPQRPRKPGHKEETTCFATSQSQNHHAHLFPFVLTYHPELP